MRALDQTSDGDHLVLFLVSLLTVCRNFELYFCFHCTLKPDQSKKQQKVNERSKQYEVALMKYINLMGGAGG
jgi:hypothetical protein